MQNEEELQNSTKLSDSVFNKLLNYSLRFSLRMTYKKEIVMGNVGNIPYMYIDKLKLELDQETVYIKTVYSVTSNRRSDVWRKCIVAIDEFLRRRSTT